MNDNATTALYDQILESDKKHFARLKQDAKRAGRGINTGYKLHSKDAKGNYKEIDLWLPKYGITMFCARTGGGKTTWMINLARQLAQNGNTGFFITLEEPGYSIRAKMLASYTRKKHTNYSMQATTTYEAMKAMSGDMPCEDMDAFDKEVMKNIRIVDANQSVDLEKVESPTLMYQPQWIADLIAYRNKQATKPLDFVIIDFGQLMESREADNANSYQRMKAVMQACKNLAGGLGIAVIIGAQLRRECHAIDIWDWEPEMIRDGSDMEQAASLILATGQDKDYPDPECNMVLRYLKNRNGPKRVAGMFNIDFEHCHIPFSGGVPNYEG